MKEMICKSNRVLIRPWELEDAEAWPPSFLQDRLGESSQTIIMKRDPA